MPLNRLGLIKTSLIDYPGEVAAVIFTAGCNLRCPFCHNPELVPGEFPADFLPVEEVIAFLERREQVLGGVCITGGEPLIHNDFKDLVDQIHNLGLKVKIDTNGTLPKRLEQITPDFVALDVKTSPGKYARLLPKNRELQLDLFAARTGSVPDVWASVFDTLKWISEAGIDFEIRTTVVPDLVTVDDIAVISRLLANDFVDAVAKRGRYVLAGYRPGNVLDPASAPVRPYPESVLEEMAAIARKNGIDCSIRPNSVSQSAQP